MVLESKWLSLFPACFLYPIANGKDPGRQQRGAFSPCFNRGSFRTLSTLALRKFNSDKRMKLGGNEEYLQLTRGFLFHKMFEYGRVGGHVDQDCHAWMNGRVACKWHR